MRYNRVIERSGLTFLILLSLTICISKSIPDILLGLSILLALIHLPLKSNRGFAARHRHTVVLLLPVAAGLVLSLFSMAGPLKGVTGFLEQYRFFLVMVPFALFAGSENSMKLIFTALNLSALGAMAYGVYNLGDNGLWVKSIGYHAIGRNSDLLISIALMNLTMLLGYRPENGSRGIVSKVLVGLNTLLMVAAVFFMLRRGSYLGLLAGGFCLLILLRKIKILILIVLAICAALYFSDVQVASRLKSITDLSGDHSNRERIQLIRTGTGYIIDENLFLRGTGAKQSDAPFREYFYSHSTDYQEQNQDIIKMNFFGNFHNSFLQMAVEYGALFLLAYLASMGTVMVGLWRGCRRLPRRQGIYPMAALVVTAGFFVSQFFHNDLYSYGGIPFLLVLAAGCRTIDGHRETAAGNFEEGVRSE